MLDLNGPREGGQLHKHYNCLIIYSRSSHYTIDGSRKMCCNAKQCNANHYLKCYIFMKLDGAMGGICSKNSAMGGICRKNSAMRNILEPI